MASAPYISQMSVTPVECNNLAVLHFSCVIKDDTDTVLTSAVTATVIVTREDEVAITASPISLSASAGKYVGDSQLTGQAGVGRLKCVFKAVYNSLNAYSYPPTYVTLRGRTNSAFA